MRLRYLALVAGLLAAQAACGKAPSSPPPAGETAGPAAALPPGDTRTIKDIMDSMVDPSGDFLFESLQDIADAGGLRQKAPKTDAEWAEVRHHLQVLTDASHLMTMDGRRAARPEDRSANPAVENQPEEVQRLMDAERPDFNRRARGLQQAAAVGMQAVDAKDKAALLQALTGIDKACETCHLHYWYPKDQRARAAAKEEGVVD
jgi:hypothetical protein